MKSINPTTGKEIKNYPEDDDKAIESTLATAQNTYASLKKTSMDERAQWMQNAARHLKDNKQEYAEIMTSEMGKTLVSAIAEVEKCALVCNYYADNAVAIMADQPIANDGFNSFVRHLPIGPVLAVMPWNFPFWQVFRFAAPALMAGNVGVLKHASNVPGSALAIAEIFKHAGFPVGAFQTLLIGSKKVEMIIKDSRIRAATLTGSEGAGSAVAAQAGKALKPTVMELGGSDPFIVMPSANIDSAVETAITARTMNNGQSCIAAKRFIVHADVYQRFEEKFVSGFEALEVGDPMQEQTDVGPLAVEQIRTELNDQVEESISKGATRLTGAKSVDGDGWFYTPGILTDIPKSAPAYSEELFGPVASLFKVNSLDEAIELANATRFGLGSSLWTTESSDIDQAISEIEAGATFVNTLVASDPKLPFGGIKDSGYGRELASDGMLAFVNRKTISVKT